MLFGPPKTKKPLHAYLNCRDIYMLTCNDKRLTKKERIALKRRIREAKKRKALNDAYIDSQNHE